MPSIPYKLIRQRRSSISLTIHPDLSVIVRAPKLMPKFFIDQFVTEKEDWIRKKLAHIEKIKPILKRSYSEGEEFLYLGQTYTLKLTPGTEIKIHGPHLLFPKALVFRAQKELTTWFKNKAIEIITQRVQYHSERMNTHYSSLTFSDTKSKWGSCGPRNDLQFNYKLIMAPLVVLDYVVIHELAHTKEKNHQEEFWKLVARETPAYKTHRKWLKAHANLLVI